MLGFFFTVVLSNIYPLKIRKQTHVSIDCHGIFILVRICKVYSMQHFKIEFVTDLWQGGGLLRVLQFLPAIKLYATI
jgi:hypothetical protein